MIYINNPPGRIGNRIISFKNALHLAIYLNMNIKSKEDIGIIYMKSGAKITIPTFVKISDSSENTIKYEHNFYYINNLLKKYPTLDKNIFHKNNDIVLKTLIEVIEFPETPIIYGNNDLHIHIRSGDIFQHWTTGPIGLDYTPPPLEFYKQCINSRQWNNIYIICQDKKNPCLDFLLKEFPKIKWNKQNILKDIQLIMGAKNIVFGQGSFIPALLLFHSNLISAYKINCKMPVGINKDYFKTYLNNKIKTYTYYCNDYFNEIGHFYNSKEQRKYMITYPKKETTITQQTINEKIYYRL